MISGRAGAVLSCVLFAGIATWQAPMNERLGQTIGALPAGVFSFLSGGLALALAVASVDGRQGLRSIPMAFRQIELRWFSGGLMGSTYVVVSILTVGDLGTGGLIAGSICGTLVGAIFIDWFALVGVRRQPPDVLTVVGALLLVASALIIEGGGAGGFVPLAATGAFAIGALVAFQPPVNARLASRMGGLRAALAQTLVGLSFISLCTVVGAVSGGHAGDAAFPPWWAFLGGLLGAGYVLATLIAVPKIGASGAAAAYIAGGLAFGVAADALGMFGLERVALGPERVGGVALMVLGSALVLRPRGESRLA